MKNKYKVPVKLWKSFSTPFGKQVFNLVYYNTIGDQKNMTHPKMKPLTTEQWQTICWNIACTAAWAYDSARQNEKEL
jgi:hypothetical protein